MSEKTPWIIAAVASVVAVAGIAAMAVSAMDEDDHMIRAENGYMGMMRGMGQMDSDEMLAGMRSILDEDDYAEMLEHMAAHRAGGALNYSGGIDGMMHRMMDGMWQQMPMDGDDLMPGQR
jgi:hypothetical protein